MYAKGQGAPQNYTEAVKWFRKAAVQGYAGAQFNLGVMYQKRFSDVQHSPLRSYYYPGFSGFLKAGGGPGNRSAISIRLPFVIRFCYQEFSSTYIFDDLQFSRKHFAGNQGRELYA